MKQFRISKDTNAQEGYGSTFKSNSRSTQFPTVNEALEQSLIQFLNVEKHRVINVNGVSFRYNWYNKKNPKIQDSYRPPVSYAENGKLDSPRKRNLSDEAHLKNGPDLSLDQFNKLCDKTKAKNTGKKSQNQ